MALFLCYSIFMAKLIGITDIHGEYEKLCNLISNLHIQKEDTIVFMGLFP